MGHEAWIKGVLFDQLLKNLLGDLVIFKMVVNLKAKCRLGLGAAPFWRKVEPIVASGFFNETLVGSTLPRSRKIKGAEMLAVFIFVLNLKGAKEFLSKVADASDVRNVRTADLYENRSERPS